MPHPKPSALKVQQGGRLLIVWDDGAQDLLPLALLRKRCPCAVCVTARGQQSASYIPLYGQAEISLASIQPVGTYALAFTWNDGHNTGIYEFPYLRSLGRGEGA